METNVGMEESDHKGNYPTSKPACMSRGSVVIPRESIGSLPNAASGTLGKRKGRLPLWKYFDMGEFVGPRTKIRWATCCGCKFVVQGQASTMARHLSKCKKASEEAREEAEVVKDSHNKKRRSKREVKSQNVSQDAQIPSIAASSVLVKSERLPEDSVLIRGYELGCGPVNYDDLFHSYLSTGFQATNFARAIDIIRKMIRWRPSKEDIESGRPLGTRCTIFLGYTSNLVSSGLREIIRWLVEHRHVDVIVTTAGGVEEDFIKCLAPTALGDFRLDGADLRKRGLNRIGNLLVPNDNYCKFEEWIMPLLDEALEDQNKKHINWTPSKLIARLGERIQNEESICYWAARNNIPIFSPALTDGSIGDMLFFHSYKNPGLRLDIIEDIQKINKISISAAATGMIILGGGVVKHHIANANLMRNGANFSVYINAAHEYDGSDSGASPDEAKSWGKIRMDAEPVKITAEATLVVPILVAQTFAKEHRFMKEEK